jgi:hypothetical protein
MHSNPTAKDKGNPMRALLTAALILTATTAVSEPTSVTADIWVDNWFEIYVNGEKVLEDSVPITTERSFNAETVKFSAELPMTIAIMAKDFKENDSGLEYIGTNRQQMGDGGMIAQFHDAATGALIAATDSTMRCLVVQHAPIDRACAKESDPVAGQGACGYVETPIPADWTAPDFDDSAWPAAVEHTTQDVSPKGGYDEIKWDPTAKLSWSDDLVLDNTLLCRLVVTE